MLNNITRQTEIISQPIPAICRINMDAPQREPSPINRQEVRIKNGDASWTSSSAKRTHTSTEASDPALDKKCLASARFLSMHNHRAA